MTTWLGDLHLWLAFGFAAVCYLVGRSHVLTGREISLALRKRQKVAIVMPDRSVQLRWDAEGDEPVIVTLQPSFFDLIEESHES